MTNDSSPLPDYDACPFCGEPAWPSFRELYAYAAQCGTAWSVDGSFTSQSAMCTTISRLRMDLALLQIAGVAS